MTAKLRYYGTEDEVLAGDRVEYASWLLRRKRLGTVVCIPAKTALELNAERKAPQNWLVELDDGTITGGMYHPEELQPSRRLRLVGRNVEYEPLTNEELEREDHEISSRSGPLDSVIGCGVIIAIAVAVLLVIVR